MTIRKTKEQDLETVCGIYADSRAFMRESGNPDQWKDNRPTTAEIKKDITDGTGYVCESDNEIAAVFHFNITDEPTYKVIDGRWLNDAPYGVVHRIARTKNQAGKGAAEFCLEWCFDKCGNLRIDTHEANRPMRKLLDKLGYVYCGKIRIENGDERFAYQKVR